MLDVVFHDDMARLRTGYGPQNMAVIRHAALNLLSQAKPAISLKNRTISRLSSRARSLDSPGSLVLAHGPAMAYKSAFRRSRLNLLQQS